MRISRVLHLFGGRGFDEDIPKTAERVAKKYNVTERTVRRDGKTAEVIALPKVGEAPGEGEERRVGPEYTGWTGIHAYGRLGRDMAAA